MAASLNNLAVLYWSQGRYAEAEPLHKQALEIQRKALGENHPDVAISLNNLGLLYADQGRYAEAEPLYKQALEIQRKALGENHPDVAQSLNNLALLYAEQGRYAEAEPLLDQAERIAQRGMCEPLLVARIHWKRADVFWHTGRKKQATGALEKALAAIEQQRTQVSGAERERAQFFGGWVNLFELMASWQYEFGHPAEVFRTMERSRARALLDQMAAAGADLLAGLPEEEAERLRRHQSEADRQVASLRKQLEVLPARQDLSPEEKAHQQQRLEAALRQAQAEYAQAYAEIRTASPAYRLAISDDQQPVSAEELRGWVQQRQALALEYLLGDKAGYLFVLPSGGQPQVVKLQLSAEQAAALGVEPGPLTAERLRQIPTGDDQTGVLDHLRASHDPKHEQQAAKGLAVLWQALIPEAQRKAILHGKYKRLVILPDAALAALPFETLVVEPGEKPQYLLDAGPPIVYAPSATVLLNLAERQEQAKQPAEQPVLSVGGCRYGQPAAAGEVLLAELSPQRRYTTLGGRLEPLKYAGWEVQWVREVFSKQGVRVAYLEGDAARETGVRLYGAGRKILHLATHGLVDQRYGNLFGALALTPGPEGSGPGDNGFLTLSEIYGLDLAGCELVILSACETNVGPAQRSEGVWSLSRGFLTAGSRRVVASNWLVDDEATASLVSIFCTYLAKAEGSSEPADYAEALYQAKRWTRQQEKWHSPYYWAPMVLLGPQ